ncbi:DUF4062 domain-containing protein [Alistipes putredinis]|uniref:DUF4062 domain-containing protein n=1 Tax=Alistipes putredinis TaxID=28117 RepID=UPI00242D644A|nr:DUF4062 domain-containing protein [Alistipes putredinis]MBS6651521.1 DUF4062 domain-containing protein [Alistipes putredinis]
MDKKYQVFVSSTFEDLKEERERVIETLLNKNCIPVGMEYFPAADDEQMTIIRQLIDECDYYVLILGGRYGSIEPKTQKSYTQLEYEYALERGIPISAFYIKDKGNLLNNKTEKNNPEKLEAFEKLVTKDRMCKSWSNADDLAGKVSLSLDYQTRHHPRIGWVKADKVASDEANNSIIKLKEENQKLKEQINFLCSASPAGSECYMQGNDLFDIHYTIPINPFNDDGERFYTVQKTWNEIFLSVCMILLKPITEKHILEHLERALFAEEYASINENDFQTILIQLMALKLIKTDTVKSEYAGVYTYWVLSQYGRAEMVRLKAIKRI